MTRKARISDARLIEAVERVAQGLFDADLGQMLFKQRLSREGHGKRGGYRMLLAYERDARAVFLFGFAKSDKSNIEDGELQDARTLGQAWLKLAAEDIERALHDGQLVEVESGNKAY